MCLTPTSGTPLPTKLNRLFRLYSMQRNTPDVNLRPRRFLDMALLFDYWTSIDLLKKWWPPAAELRPELGGTYHFSWPKQDWAPSGQVHHVRQREDARLHVEVGP